MIIKLSFSSSAFPKKCRHSYGVDTVPSFSFRVLAGSSHWLESDF